MASSGPEATGRILQRLTTSIAHSSSPLSDPDRMEELLASSAVIVEQVVADLMGRHDPELAVTSKDLGNQRAQQGIHPRHSLAATLPLFEIALNELSQEFPDHPQEQIAVSLYRHLTDRLAFSAAGYIDVLLGQLSTAQQAERQRVAREMHDRVAHEVGAAALTIELLLNQHQDTLGERPTERLELTLQQLRLATEVVRKIASDLRDAVAGRTLNEALDGYLLTAKPASIAVTTDVSLPADVPSHTLEQIYLITREALRNAFLHSGGTKVEVSAVTSPGLVQVRVTDNGIGIRRSGPGPESTGLTSMRERAEALNGTVQITSPPSAGTSVEIIVPI